jgi:hypothetical protein
MKDGPFSRCLVPALVLAILLWHAAAASESSQTVLERIADAYENAWWARLLGWIAVVLGVLNLAALGVVTQRLARGGWSLLAELEWPIIATRRRQRMLGRSLGELNAQFEDIDADRPRLHDTLKAVSEHLRSVRAEAERRDAGA